MAKKRKRKINVIKQTIKIKQPEKVYIELCQPESINYSLNEISNVIGESDKVTRNFLQELQLYALNVDYRTRRRKTDYLQDLEFYYPTINQFPLNQVDVMCNFAHQLPRGYIAKYNQIVRYYQYCNKRVYPEVIGRFLGVNKDTIGKFKRELSTVIETGNNKKILNFGVKCGLHQLTEKEGGAVQSLVWTYFLMKHPEFQWQMTSDYIEKTGPALFMQQHHDLRKFLEIRKPEEIVMTYHNLQRIEELFWRSIDAPESIKEWLVSRLSQVDNQGKFIGFDRNFVRSYKLYRKMYLTTLKKKVQTLSMEEPERTRPINMKEPFSLMV